MKSSQNTLLTQKCLIYWNCSSNSVIFESSTSKARFITYGENRTIYYWIYQRRTSHSVSWWWLWYRKYLLFTPRGMYVPSEICKTENFHLIRNLFKSFLDKYANSWCIVLYSRGVVFYFVETEDIIYNVHNVLWRDIITAFLYTHQTYPLINTAINIFIAKTKARRSTFFIE